MNASWKLVLPSSSSSSSLPSPPCSPRRSASRSPTGSSKSAHALDRLGFAVAILAAAFCLIASVAPAADVPVAASTEAETVWTQRCSTCHGTAGKGDGAAAAALTPKPRDFTLATWQSSVTDEHIEKTIVEGGQAVGLSMLMVGNPDLASKPDVVRALRAHVRSLAGR